MFVIAVSLFLFAGLSLPYAQEYSEGKVIGYGRSPQFVTDSTVAFINPQGLLTLVNLNDGSTKEIGNKPITGFRPTINGFVVWDWQSLGIGMSSQTIRTLSPTGDVKSEIELSDSRTGKKFTAPVILPDSTVGYWVRENGNMFFETTCGGGPETLDQWIGDIKPNSPHVNYGEIWLRRVNGSEARMVLPGKNYWPRSFYDGSQQCSNKLLVVHEGNLNVIEFDSTTDSDSVWQLGNPNELIGRDVTVDGVEYEIVLGATVASSARWSPDCQWAVATYELAGAKHNEDDFNIISSDIQVMRVDGSINVKIETPDIVESNPNISSDGAVVCETEKGEIVIYKRRA
jgi:hypothetical protein